jgi:predicted membrane chloride channel (bestrophin family)
MMTLRLMLCGSLLATACGGQAWGHEDGFSDKLSDGCTTQEECDQLVGAARWRARQCAATHREGAACDQVHDDLRAAENIANAKKMELGSEAKQQTAQKLAVQQQASQEKKAECEVRAAELKAQLGERDRQLQRQQQDLTLLQEQLKSSEAVIETLTPKDKKK